MGGELTESVPELNATRPDEADAGFDDFHYSDGEPVAALADPQSEAAEVLRRAGVEPTTRGRGERGRRGRR